MCSSAGSMADKKMVSGQCLAGAGTMNAGGWFFMLTSLALVWGVTIWAYYRLLKAPREKD